MSDLTDLGSSRSFAAATGSPYDPDEPVGRNSVKSTEAAPTRFDSSRVVLRLAAEPRRVWPSRQSGIGHADSRGVRSLSPLTARRDVLVAAPLPFDSGQERGTRCAVYMKLRHAYRGAAGPSLSETSLVPPWVTVPLALILAFACHEVWCSDFRVPCLVDLFGRGAPMRYDVDPCQAVLRSVIRTTWRPDESRTSSFGPVPGPAH